LVGKTPARWKSERQYSVVLGRQARTRWWTGCFISNHTRGHLTLLLPTCVPSLGGKEQYRPCQNARRGSSAVTLCCWIMGARRNQSRKVFGDVQTEGRRRQRQKRRSLKTFVRLSDGEEAEEVWSLLWKPISAHNRQSDSAEGGPGNPANHTCRSDNRCLRPPRTGKEPVARRMVSSCISPQRETARNLWVAAQAPHRRRRELLTQHVSVPFHDCLRRFGWVIPPLARVVAATRWSVQNQNGKDV